MSFVAPLWLAAAAVIGLGVVVAHLFSTNVPPGDLLPTVRFVPESAPMTVVRTRRLSDYWLLLLRLLAIALLGLALAGLHVSRTAPRRVVLVDLSRAIGSVGEVRDSVEAVATPGVLLVAFDSAARRIERDSLNGLLATVGSESRASQTPPGTSLARRPRGSLSAGLVAAHRASSDAGDNRDETELVLVSPVVREEVDSATRRLLALWEGPVRVVRVRSAPNAVGATSWDVRVTTDDPVAAALASPSRGRGSPAVRVVRTVPTPGDSLWARDSAGALVLWPANSIAARALLLRRATADSQGGIATARDVVIAPFARDYQPREGRTLVRWLDGAPAATEQPLGRGCVREVAIPVDAVGDVSLRESFRGLARSLVEPCGGARDMSAAALASRPPSEGDEAVRQGSAAPVRPQPGAQSFWLALGALAVLLVEQVFRSRKRRQAGAAA